MNSTTMLLLVILATLALVQGIAIGGNKGSSSSSSVATAETTATGTVNVNNGFAVQKGYEGYFLTPQKATGSSSNSNTWIGKSKLQIIKNLLKSIPTALIVYGFKTFKVLAHLFIALVLGVVTTSALCTLTPLCTISLAYIPPGLGFPDGQSVAEKIAALASPFMTPENLGIATELAQSAIQRYSRAPILDERAKQEPANEEEN